jgi:redox-sensitive bicupin YhaK (pirin superfamily)
MIIVRKSEERRHIEAKNQKTWMTFDHENQSDPLRNGFGVLKILNEEILPPGSGFVLHTHKDMVVVTYVREGMIIYKGPLEKLDPLASAEFHQSHTTPEAKQYAINIAPMEETHVFQSGFTHPGGAIDSAGTKKLFTYAQRNGILRLVASPDGRETSLPLQQDVYIYSTFIHKGNHMIHELSPGRSAWLHVVKGRIQLEGYQLTTGDGAGLSLEMSVSFTAQEPTEILIFDMGDQVPEETKTRSQNKTASIAV